MTQAAPEAEATFALQVPGPPPYPVYLEEGLALRCGPLFERHGIKRAVLISNPVIGSLHGASVRNAIREGGVDVDSLEVPDGEAYKDLSTLGRLFRDLADIQADRSTTLVALGGGVIGDLVGFAAATWCRGVPLVHIPTTVLAMVDSSIGGKVAVDLPQGKNLVGAFYNPCFVISDPSLLMSLPPRHIAAGMAEIIKSAVLASPELWETLQTREPALGPQDLDQLIARAVNIKVQVVSEDPFERGVRATLNLGHTLGHALEAARGYHQILHGEAVSLGLVAAVRIARAMGVLEEDFEPTLLALLERYRLPVRMDDVGWTRIEAAMKLDKKRELGRLRFILPVRVGQVVVRDDVPLDVVREAYESLVVRQEEPAAAEGDEYEETDGEAVLDLDQD